MASQFASRPFATFLLACLLGDFTSSFILPNLLSSILSVNFSLMRPPFISIASSRPTPSSPTVYVILPPIDGESATTTTTQATPTIPLETTTISAPELSPTVATTPVVEPQPIMANAPEPPGGVNGEAAESPPANAP